MNSEELSCALRALSLCDGQEVVDYRRALGPRCGCYCWLLDGARDLELPTIAQTLRTDRARTVARSSELERTVTRHQEMVARPSSRPPF